MFDKVQEYGKNQEQKKQVSVNSAACIAKKKEYKSKQNVTSEIKSDQEKDLSSAEAYTVDPNELVIPASRFSWKAVNEDGKKALGIAAKQFDKCIAYRDYLRKELPFREKAKGSKEAVLMERQRRFDLSMQALTIVKELLRESEKGLKNYYGFDEILKAVQVLVANNPVRANSLLTTMKDADLAYKGIFLCRKRVH